MVETFVGNRLFQRLEDGVGTGGDTATASGSVPTYAKLNALKHQLDQDYRLGASFLMNDYTAGVIEGIVDSIGRPILVPLLQGIGFGNWGLAYVVRQVRDVQILVNPYAATGYVVYDAWARMDGTVQDFTAYVTMEGLT